MKYQRVFSVLTSGCAAACFNLLFSSPAAGQSPDLPVVKQVELQPLAAHVKRVVEALDYLGAPLSAEERRTLDAAMATNDPAAGVAGIQEILDRHCLVGLNINPEMRVKAAPGPAKPQLVAEGWRTFLIKVQNDAGATAELRLVSP